VWQTAKETAGVGGSKKGVWECQGGSARRQIVAARRNNRTESKLCATKLESIAANSIQETSKGGVRLRIIREHRYNLRLQTPTGETQIPASAQIKYDVCIEHHKVAGRTPGCKSSRLTVIEEVQYDI